ncbi:MAG: alcohol dehydrogenase catalytic domain-containing protein [Spirochaetota bacterium]|nr:MAG: alcohol dehydrogenase catalytic domain-containing protein [Spirochaetota bacterium]
MKAIVKYEKPGSYEVVDNPVPEIKSGEVLIKVRVTGICHTDVSILENRYKGKKPVPIPVIMGHEGTGEIADVKKIKRSFKVGQRVGFEALNGCGQCYFCKAGHKNMCNDWSHIGITRDGTFAEYIALPEELVHPLPDEVTFSSAALLEPLSLVVRSLEHVKPEVGDSAVIIGPGSIGLLHLLALKSAGVSKIVLIGIDKDEKKLEMAKSLGADYTINSSQEDPVEKVMEITKGMGTDIVIETASSPVVWDFLLDLVAAKGRISCFGLHDKSNFRPLSLIRKGATLYGDVAFLTRHFLRAIKWLETGKVHGEAIITHRFSLEQAKKALDTYYKGDSVKITFEM